MIPAAQSINDAAVLISKHHQSIKQLVEGVKSEDIALPDALKLFFELKSGIDLLEEQVKLVKEQVSFLSEVALPERFRSDNVKTITLDDIGRRFTMSNRFFASMPDKEGGKQWLRDNGLGDIIQETVNASTLAGVAKDYLETKGEDLPTEFFNVTIRSTTSMTKVKSK